MHFHLQTLGCKSNQYESQAIRESLLARGHTEAAGPESAEVFILNSCGVTGRAAASCRNAMQKALRANPRLAVVVTGCCVDLDERWPDSPGPAPILVPNAQKHALADLLDSLGGGGEPPPLEPGDGFDLGISAFHGHTRAFLKIQDGCDNYCSYCAVPLARGEPRSRSPEEILAEAARLAANGHGELVLTGINIGAYRRDGVTFADIVRRIADTPGLVRLRLGSVEPPSLTPGLVDAMRDHERICPHVHLPLQSGDDRILRAMNRRYTSEEFLDAVDFLHSRLRLPAVTTDVIVGFPGEDEEAFAATFELCRRAGFSRLHVFPYSPRPGTPAATMRRTVPERVVEEWKTRLILEGQAAAAAFAAGCVGLDERVILEKAGARREGLGDRYVRVVVDGGGGRAGEVVKVRITGAEGAELRGRCESASM